MSTVDIGKGKAMEEYIYYLKRIDKRKTKREMMKMLNLLFLCSTEEILDYINYTGSIITVPDKNKLSSSMDKKYLNAMEKKEKKAAEIHMVIEAIKSLNSPYKDVLLQKYVYKNESKKICNLLKISERTYRTYLFDAYIFLAVKLDMEILLPKYQ